METQEYDRIGRNCFYDRVKQGSAENRRAYDAEELWVEEVWGVGRAV
jgi:hypothetical protein